MNPTAEQKDNMSKAPADAPPPYAPPPPGMVITTEYPPPAAPAYGPGVQTSMYFTLLFSKEFFLIFSVLCCSKNRINWNQCSCRPAAIGRLWRRAPGEYWRRYRCTAIVWPISHAGDLPKL